MPSKDLETVYRLRSYWLELNPRPAPHSGLGELSLQYQANASRRADALAALNKKLNAGAFESAIISHLWPDGLELVILRGPSGRAGVFFSSWGEDFSFLGETVAAALIEALDAIAPRILPPAASPESKAPEQSAAELAEVLQGAI